jgi:hypothetical protein
VELLRIAPHERAAAHCRRSGALASRFVSLVTLIKYLCLVYLDQEHWTACPDRLCAGYAQQLSDSKRLIAGEPLHPVHTGRRRDGSRF